MPRRGGIRPSLPSLLSAKRRGDPLSYQKEDRPLNQGLDSGSFHITSGRPPDRGPRECGGTISIVASVGSDRDQRPERCADAGPIRRCHLEPRLPASGRVSNRATRAWIFAHRLDEEERPSSLQVRGSSSTSNPGMDAAHPIDGVEEIGRAGPGGRAVHKRPSATSNAVDIDPSG